MAMPDPASDPFGSGQSDPWASSDPSSSGSLDPQPSAPADPTPAAKDPTVSKTNWGLLLLVVGIIAASVLAIINTFLPTLIDSRFTYIAPLIFLAGAVLIFAGRKAWQVQGRTAVVGFALVVAGVASTIILGLLGAPYFFSVQGQSMAVGSSYHTAFLFTHLWNTINVGLLTVGTLLLVWKITSESPKKLIVAGNLIFLGYTVAGLALSLVLYDPTVGGVNPATQPVVALLLGLSLLFLMVSNALQVLGFVFARLRLPPASSGAASSF